MSGVGVTGLIANLPGTVTPYPVLDFSLGLGGVRTVSLVSDMTAIGAQFRVEGMIVYVKKTQCFYALAPDLTTWTIVANNGRLGLQAAWYIDPTNSSGTASDSNDGLTAATPLLTQQQWEDRVYASGGSLVIRQNTTVNYLGTVAFSIPHMRFNVVTDITTATVFTFNVIPPLSSTANMPLTAVTVTSAVPGSRHRGELTVSSGAFTAGERIRVTTGAATGAMAYSLGAHAGATNHYVTNFGIDQVNNFNWPAIGDNVVVDTLLLTTNRLDLYAGQLVRLNVQGCKVTSLTVNGSSSDAQLAAGGGNCTLTGCQQISASGHWNNNAGGATLVNCRTIATSKTSLIGAEWALVNHYVQGSLGIGSGSAISYGIAIDAGHLVVGTSPDFNHLGDDGWSKLYVFGISAGTNVGGIEVENGVSGTAIQVSPGACLMNDSFQSDMWGVSGTYAIGFDLYGACICNDSNGAQTLSNLLAIPATTGYRIGGAMSFAYSDTPAWSSQYQAGVIMQNLSGTRYQQAAIYKTAQAANIAATSFSAGTPYKGSYRVSGYLAITTASGVGGAGNLVLSATWTDDSGVVQTQPICSLAALTAAGGTGGQLIIESNGATALQWSVSGIAAAGLVQYSVRVNLTLESLGS